MAVAAIVLAAGDGRRVGRPKAWLTVHDRSFLEHVVDSALAAGISTIVGVVDPHQLEAREVLERLARRPRFSWTRGRAPERGPIDSLVAGLDALATPHDVLVWPVDHVGVAEETVRAIVNAGQERRNVAVVPQWNDRGGHPVWLPASWCASLRELPMAGTLRDVLRARIAQVDRLVVEDAWVTRDVDTLDELEAVRRAMAERSR